MRWFNLVRRVVGSGFILAVFNTNGSTFESCNDNEMITSAVGTGSLPGWRNTWPTCLPIPPRLKTSSGRFRESSSPLWSRRHRKATKARRRYRPFRSPSRGRNGSRRRFSAQRRRRKSPPTRFNGSSSRRGKPFQTTSKEPNFVGRWKELKPQII